jgi:D-alanyl-D-alanine carboxypeptidase
VAITALVLSGCSGSDGKSDSGGKDAVPEGVSKSVDSFAEKAMKASKSSEAIVGVWLPDGKSYVSAYGNDKLKTDAPLRAAETTAPASCAALLQLVQNGTLDLDREISKDLTRQVDIDKITYKQLCDGTSGLADYQGAYKPLAEENPTRPWNVNELLAQGLTKSPLPGAGEDVYVSNTDPLVLARAMRANTTHSTSRLLERYVFDPAKMKNTEYPDTSEDQLPSGSMTALTYPRKDNKPVCEDEPTKLNAVSPSILGAAGATVTTADDLHRFYSAFFDAKYGGKKLFNSVMKPKSLVNPKRDKDNKIVEEAPKPKDGEVTHEYAWGMEKIGPLYGRTGSLPGEMTAAYIEPESGMTVIVSLNNSAGDNDLATATAFGIAADIAEDAKVEIPWKADDKSKEIDSHAICK